MRQLTLDLTASGMATFVDDVSAALEATGRYPWLKDHPMTYQEQEDGSAIVRSSIGGCWSPASLMPPHQVLYAIADAIERSGCCG